MHSQCAEVIAAIRALVEEEAEDHPPTGELAEEFVAKCIENDA